MSAADTVKDVVRIATTAGLAKDVIDLLEKKASLLAEQVSAFEKENTTLLRENRKLALENQNLTGQLQSVRPKGALDEKAAVVLKYFFDNPRDVSVAEVARHFNMVLSLANYHIDALREKNFIDGGAAMFGSRPSIFDDDMGERDDSPKYEITAKGRKFVIESGMAN